MKDMTPIEDATVLVVDDDPGAQLLARSALELAGFRVVTAQDGVQGLASFNAHSPDCIVLDVIMPGMNGFEMCERVRSAQHGLHVPILMMTSLDDTESVSRAYTVGATDFASKGVNPMLLAQRVKFLVRSKHIQDRLRASEARVRYLAYYDPLTRLPNRQRLVEILEQMIAWATAHNHKIAVMTLNIDDFSRINDILGQTNGDALIAEIALRLQNCLRDPSRTIDHPGAEIDMTDPTDALARIGGDEFALVMPRVPNSDAAALGARRIQAALARPFLIAQQELPVSATIGISFFPDDGADAQALTKNAQAAMHHGKKLGRGGCQFFMRSAQGPGPPRVQAAFSAAFEAAGSARRRRGSFAALAAPATRHGGARRIHTARRANRLDRGYW
jgi:diguanylate cyclase